MRSRIHPSIFSRFFFFFFLKPSLTGNRSPTAQDVLHCVIQSNILKLKSYATILKQHTDVQALIKIHPQKLHKSKNHSLDYLPSTASHLYACTGPHREHVENVPCMYKNKK